MNFGKHILKYFLKTLEKCWKFREHLWDIYYIVELFRIFSRNLLKTSKKKCRKSKFWINFEKINEKHLGNFKLLILRKLWRILNMFLSSFSEISKKFWRKVENTLYKCLDILKGNFETFLCQFLEKLVKNYPKNVKLFWENFGIIWKNYKIIILETFWEFLGKCVH